MGHLHIRKLLKAETTWKEKNSNRHKCNFNEHCILKVISKDNKTKYYNVLKCSQCLSFTSIREPGNVQGHIFTDLSDDQKRLPQITAYNNKNIHLIINFADLENVSYSNKI